MHVRFIDLRLLSQTLNRIGLLDKAYFKLQRIFMSEVEIEYNSIRFVSISVRKNLTNSALERQKEILF